MSIEKKEISRIIEQYLEGKISPKDREILLDWLQDPDNKEYFHNFCSDWMPENDEQLDKSWNKIQSLIRHIDESKSVSPNRDRFIGKRKGTMSRKQFINIAAFFVLGMVATFLLTAELTGYWKDQNKLQWVQAETRAGQKVRIILPDSSVVWLNSESSIAFPPNFDSRSGRVVKLQGEAFFDVKHKPRTFTVRCPDYDVIVIGTQFNVMAYKDFNRTETTLVEGSVSIKKGNQTLSLSPGERAIYSRNYLIKSKAQVRQAILWKDNKFYFDNIPFKELVRRLERWYDVDISLNDNTLNDIYYSGYFKNEETVWQVLDVIQLTTPIVYERKQFREIVINRKLMQADIN